MQLIRIFLFLALLLGSAACSRGVPTVAPTVALPEATTAPPPSPLPAPSETPTPSGTHGTVVLWHAWDSAEVPALVQIIRDFQDQYPDVLFYVLYIPVADLQARFISAAEDGTAPSVLIGPAEWGPALYDAGLLSDLNGQVAAEALARLNGAALGEARYQGAQIGLPESIRGVVMYRNRQIIPEPPRSFDDLLLQAREATEGDTIGADLERGFFFSGAHLDGLGGKLMEEDGSPAFDSEAGATWMQLMQDFAKAGPTEFMSDRDLELFKQGNVGLIIDGTWSRDDLAASIGADNLQVDPWPTYGAGHLSGYVQAENLYLSTQATGEDRAASLKFMEYFLSQEAQTQMVGIGRLPAAADIKVDDRLLAQTLTALQGGSPYPIHPAMAYYLAPLTSAMQAVFTGAMAPADALRTAYNAVLAAQAAGESGAPSPTPFTPPTSSLPTPTVPVVTEPVVLPTVPTPFPTITPTP